MLEVVQGRRDRSLRSPGCFIDQPFKKKFFFYVSHVACDRFYRLTPRHLFMAVSQCFIHSFRILAVY